ncbi:Speckle-type POZ protein [Hordeum vulgare]|nr:Speckle-type POZ protein [Hordeum vulgare]
MATTIKSQDQATSARLSLLQSWRVCHLPLGFTKHFLAIPSEFKLKTNTACAWRVTVRLFEGRVTLNQGWAIFTAVHHIMIGYMLTFKLLTPDTMKVIVFDDEGVEVITKCKVHKNAFAAIA